MICLFNKKGWKNWISTCKRIKLDPNLRPRKKIIKEPNVRTEAVKFLEESIKEKLHNIEFDNEFSNMTPKHRGQKKLGKLVLIKIKVIKNNSKRFKR
jgi:hypothetical protein